MRRTTVIGTVVLLALFVLQAARCLTVCTVRLCETAQTAPTCPHESQPTETPESCEGAQIAASDFAPAPDMPAVAPPSEPASIEPAAALYHIGPPSLQADPASPPVFLTLRV